MYNIEPELVAISNSTSYDDTAKFSVEFARVLKIILRLSESDKFVAMMELALHMEWLMKGSLDEVRTLRSNVRSFCTPEVAMKVFQD